jgi:hypothetical protein
MLKGNKMQDIVLITRENSERVTHVSVFLCGNYSEAKHFCHFANRLSITGGEKLFARIITANAEYSLGKYQPFSFDDLAKLNDRTIQKIMREIDSQMLALALTNAKEEVKDTFFRNMSKRAVSLLKEDIEYLSPVTETDIENARQFILDVYDDLSREDILDFDEAWSIYKELKKNNVKDQVDSDDKNHIVLVFRGTENTANFVAVYLFNDYDTADHFCSFLNDLEPDKGTFFYARHADQMVEYETTKPLLVSFDKIFEIGGHNGEWNTALIIREALKKFNAETLSQALFRLDKHSRIFILQNLPVKTRDEVNENIECFMKSNQYYPSLRTSREVQKKILNAINRTYDKFRQGKLSGAAEILKD